MLKTKEGGDMTQPNDAWIEEMSRLLKEHQRALAMRDQWERKRVEAAAAIDAFRNSATVPATDEPVPTEEPAQV
jgi:hypothetical protein